MEFLSRLWHDRFRRFWIIFFKELTGFFYSPIAWVVMALVMLLNGFFFRAALAILEAAPSEGSVVTWSFNSQWFWLAYFFIFPLLTMRLFAEEQKLGTLETLMTAPVRTWEIVGAKFSAAFIFYLLLWLPSVFNFIYLQWLTAERLEVPMGQLMGSYLLIFFMGAFNLAVGCLASALTANQIIAAMVAFTLSIMHFLLGVFVQVGRNVPEKFIDFVNYISSNDHIRMFTSGLVDTRPMIYYSSLTLLCLVLTHQIVESRRWRG
jgi:ABC-2 type transport system permease protein